MTNAQAHLIRRWGVTVWLSKARLSMRVPCEMRKPLACLRGRLIAHERAVGCLLGYYITLLLDQKSEKPTWEEGQNRVVDLLFNVARCLRSPEIEAGFADNEVEVRKWRSAPP